MTAQQLFGVPSSAPVRPARPQPTNGLAAAMTASHIPPWLADQIMEVIEKHDIPKDACRRMLTRAASKHAENQTGNPDALEHCGYLFKTMIADWGRGESKRQEITAVHRSRSYNEIMAEEAMNEMRFPFDAKCLLNHAVRSESLALDDGGAVPCPLNWEAVTAVHKKTKGDFVRFKEEIARSIFTFDAERPPRCRWYDLWMAAKQLPLPNDEPLIAGGVKCWDLREIRDRIDEWVGGFLKDKTERIEYGNTFVWLASLQAREKSAGAMLDAMELLARQVRRDAPFPVIEESEETEGRLVFRRW